MNWERKLRPFLTRQELLQKGLRLAVVQRFQPPPPFEGLIDFCGQDRLCPGVASKVFDSGLSISLPTPTPHLEVSEARIALG